MTKNKEELQSKIDNLLENLSNSLENCKNDNYKKGLYPFKIMKQLLIQLSSDVFLNKEGVPSVKIIDKNKFEDVFNIINTYVETHNIDEIEGLLYSEHISKDLGLKKCYNKNINLFIYNKQTEGLLQSKIASYDVAVHFETFCGSSEFYTGHSEYDKVIKNVLKQGQESDVSKKYLKDIKHKCSVRIPLFEPNGLRTCTVQDYPFYRVQDNTYTVIPDGLDMYGEPKCINGELYYTTDGYVKANGTILHQNYEFTGELKNYFYKGIQVFAEHAPYEYIMPAKDIEDM